MAQLTRPRRRAAVALLCVVAPACLARAASAQRVTSTLDIGGAGLRYADSISTTAASVTPAVRLDWARVTLTGAGTASALGEGGWSTQGRVEGSLFTAAAGPVVGELLAVAGGSAHQDGTRTGEATAVGRAHLIGTGGGAWGGAAAGRVWDGLAWHSVRLAEGGAWAHRGATTALLSLTPTAVDDDIRYLDATLAVRHDVARVELGASVGVRSGEGIPSAAGSARSWGGANVVLWLTERTGVVLGAGSYPVDVTRGFPGGRYASASLRLGSGGARSYARRVAAHADANVSLPAPSRDAPALAHGVLAMRVDAAAGERRVLRVHAPGARSLEIAGDFTGWTPVSLTRAGGGWWTTSVRLPRGTHQVNLRVDRRTWIVPPGLSRFRDEFGGAVGLLVVE